MHQRLIDKEIIKGYAYLASKIDEIRDEIQQLLRILTTPVKLTQNERLMLLNLPTHLAKTYFTLQDAKKATATQISKLTGKMRSVESGYLNQLVTMGFCLKDPNSREVVFSCNAEEEGRR